jgi:hypothetical protein
VTALPAWRRRVHVQAPDKSQNRTFAGHLVSADTSIRMAEGSLEHSMQLRICKKRAP